MSGQISQDGKVGFFGAVRQVVVRVVYAHWALLHEPLGIARGVKLVQDAIIQQKKAGDPITGEPWHYSMVPNELTVRRRFNEAANREFYEGADPPLKCIGRRQYQGSLESQYQPFDA